MVLMFFQDICIDHLFVFHWGTEWIMLRRDHFVSTWIFLISLCFWELHGGVCVTIATILVIFIFELARNNRLCFEQI